MQIGFVWAGLAWLAWQGTGQAAAAGDWDLRLLFNQTERCVRSLWAASPEIKSRFTLRQMAGTVPIAQREDVELEAIGPEGCARSGTSGWRRRGNDGATRRGPDSRRPRRPGSTTSAHVRTSPTASPPPVPPSLPHEQHLHPQPWVLEGEQGGERRKRQAALTPPRALRKEYRRLTDHERRRFHKALSEFKVGFSQLSDLERSGQALESDMLDGRSKFDLLVWYHQPSQAPAAHWGPAFLPWHREFLRQCLLSFLVSGG